MKRTLFLIVLLSLVFVVLSFADFQRFRVTFPQCSLTYVPSSGTLQISANNRVLSYGGDWTVRKIYPYLYHLKLNTWSGFFWMVNTSRKQVFKVTGATFGQLGGNQTLQDINVQVVGGANNTQPDRFLLNFTDAYLIYNKAAASLQIVGNNFVLSYGNDWQTAEIYPYLFHLKQNFWSSFFWKVNTSRGEIYEVRDGTFGTIAPGTSTVLPFPVIVYN